MADAQDGIRPEWLEAMSVLTVQPGDIIVVRSSRLLSPEGAGRLTSRLREVFPDNQVMVLDGLDIGVVRNGAVPPR
jgi:hypothetical protein